MKPESFDTLRRCYPILDQLDAQEVVEVLSQHANAVEVPAGTTMFTEGQPCRGFPMVTEGTIRVARGSPEGRSLELYRVTAGEICVVSTSCLFGRSSLSAHGVATDATKLVLLQPEGFARWIGTPAFREFVFGIFADRLAELMALAEAVAFQRLDQRLASALLGHGGTLRATHQRLADELGTVREIVSRLLQRFERAGWIVLGRERITIVDALALRRLAEGQPGLR